MASLKGLRAIVTSGPTYEPIDPVRFLGNRSSGKQGHAIASVLAREGAEVTLITGPVSLADPGGVNVIHVTTAREMLAAVRSALPADIAVFAAAVSDWRAKRVSGKKFKKDGGPHELELVENPDILKAVTRLKQERPGLVIGFAAETENVVHNARAKRFRKGCDWIVANDVSGGKAFDAEENKVTLITAREEISFGLMHKRDIAETLVTRIIHFSEEHLHDHRTRRPA